MNLTEEQIDNMDAGQALDDLLIKCGLYEGDGSPSTNPELATEILHRVVPLFSGERKGLARAHRSIKSKPGGGYTGSLVTDNYAITAEAETEALLVSRMLAKYCLKQEQ